MTAATFQEPVVEPGVQELLRRHAAEPEFLAVVDLTRKCFPEARSINVRLVEDPDEDNHTWVAFHVVVPVAHPADALGVQRKRFHEELTHAVKIPYHPLSFALSVHRHED